MTKFESKIGIVKTSEEKIFNFLSDFTNFENMIPKDKMKDWQATGDICSFSIDGVGELKMNIIDKEPFKTIKYGGDGRTAFNFWVQIKEVAENDSRIKLTLKAELNMMMKMMVSKPLKAALDAMVDRIEVYFENN